MIQEVRLIHEARGENRLAGVVLIYVHKEKGKVGITLAANGRWMQSIISYNL